MPSGLHRPGVRQKHLNLQDPTSCINGKLYSNPRYHLKPFSRLRFLMQLHRLGLRNQGLIRTLV